MKINIKSNFGLNKPDFEAKSSTLGGLLGELYGSNGVIAYIIDSERGQVDPNYLVIYNGQPLEALRDGVDTRLQDGDTVLVYGFFISGGG